uniref:Uncharacterized protein n=1 Tax=Arundo donax TaxID=35708 RepID=A0A0A9CIP9_ARUDO
MVLYLTSFCYSVFKEQYFLNPYAIEMVVCLDSTKYLTSGSRKLQLKMSCVSIDLLFVLTSRMVFCS